MLDNLRGGITEDDNDAIIYDIGLMGKSSSGYGHPTGVSKEEEIAKQIGATAAAK